MTTDPNAATWTASDLLTDVYRACRLPSTGTVDYTPSVVLREASDAIWNFAGHAVAQARGGRLATTLLRAVTTASITTSGQDYELPPMSVGDTIDSVVWVNAAGSTTIPLQVIPLGLEETYWNPTSTGQPEFFALLDGVVRVYPKPSESGSLRITYQRRHGQLVVSGTDTSSVSSVSDNGGYARVTLTSTPASFVAGAWIDFMGSKYPYRIKIHGASITTAHGSNQFTLSTTYAAFVAASLTGDMAVLYGYTPYVQLPLELRQPLTQHVAGVILGQIGDQVGLTMDQKAERGAARAKEMLSPRTKYAREKAYNPRSLVRGMMRTRNRFGVL